MPAAWNSSGFLSALVACLALAPVLEQPIVQAADISGNVSFPGGPALGGVTIRAVRIFPTADSLAAQTDGSGNYLITGASGSYIVTASNLNYTFTPTFTNVTAGGTADFLAATTPVASNPSSADVKAISATLLAFVNARGTPTTAWFEYGTTTNLGSFTSPTNIGTTGYGLLLGIPVTNLLRSTSYSYRAVVSNSLAVAQTDIAGFSTRSGSPSVATLPLSGPGGTSVQLNGQVNPNGAAAIGWFEFGTTTNYDTIAVAHHLGNGTGLTNFNDLLIGLTPGNTYHYRAAAMTVYATNVGADIAFTPIFAETGVALPGLAFGSVAWGDYDNDGRLDLLLSGTTNTAYTEAVSQIWRNTGSGFTNINAGLPGVTAINNNSAVAWSDYNRDGHLDFLLAGLGISNSPLMQLWRNTGSGFVRDTNTLFPGIYECAAAWGDYNRDGAPDILLAGWTTTQAVAQIWRNAEGSFIQDTNIALPGVFYASVAWGDYDNDGWLDFLLAGTTDGTGDGVVNPLWRNTGAGFVNVTNVLPQFGYGSVAWGDYDQDGRLDVLLQGFNGNRITELWRNTGTGFAKANISLVGLADGAVAWGDCDNDGWLDILLTGSVNASPSGTRGKIYRNNRNGTFTDLNDSLPALFRSSVGWGDYDNDGRLDIVMSGRNASGLPITRLLRNLQPVTNTPPAQPSGLNVSVSGQAIVLGWNTAADNETTSVGLSYNLRLGTTPGGTDLLSPLAAAEGFRRVPQTGNAQLGLNGLIELEVGKTYYWSVQAVDNAFAGSAFASEQSFTLVPAISPDSPLVSAPHWLGNGTLEFYFTNQSSFYFRVLASTNLADWTVVAGLTEISPGTFRFHDPVATNHPQRFYRLRWP
jgi:hypothetical protein